MIGMTAIMTPGETLAQSSTAEIRLTIETLLDIKHPSNPVWSPDGQHIAYLWDRAGVVNLYVQNSDGQGQPLALTSFPDGSVSDPFWNRDSQAVFFTRGGNLWQVAATGGHARTVITPGPAQKFLSEIADWSEAGSFVPSPDRTKLAFIRTGNASEGSGGVDLVVRSLFDGTELAIAHDGESMLGPIWSPDGTQVAYIGGSKVVRHDETPSYSGEKINFAVFEYVSGQVYVASTTGGKPAAIDSPGEYDGLAWVDSAHLSYDRQSDSYKTRTIYVATANGGTPQLIHQDKEEKFWSMSSDSEPEPKPSPDGKWIAFLTDLDGWDHLYVIPAKGGQSIQITKGHFEVRRPRWSHDSTRIVFDANESDHPGDWRLGIATLGSDPTGATIRYITSGAGTNVSAEWSPDDKRLVYQHTDPHNSADFFVTAATTGTEPVRLSDSMPPGVDRAAFVEPQLVHYPGADGQSVPAWLFVPKNLDRTKKHPAIVWIHGDGINQNYNGWHVERNYAVYYSYHQYLLQQGYVVIAPDYRGSIGYGREWRNGVYMDVGGNDAKDARMAANYLSTLSYVDSGRMGVWGLSYGGFFTLIAMTEQPTLFKAGVDVAGTADYAMYYRDPYHNDWTEGRLGTPQQNPKIYANASPVSHVDRLARPLLVLHGTADVNVPFLQTVWLMDEALKKNKGDLIQFMIYPGEFHYFAREHVLRDAWNRVDRFFSLQLRGTNQPEH
jgi:dipeptidyl aminopeptidase/acylaminoacyl peptidase